jgi:ATP-dependent exoDNAse (exonuclease V) alpha subunit
MLNVDREDAFKVLNTGENIFLTGNAGAGKTYLIKEFAKKSGRNVALTATTGIAALNLGGETVHRFLGIGITTRPELSEPIVKKLNKFRNSSKPWEKRKWQLLNSLDTLVIDEASMLRRDQFELIEVVLGSIKDNTKPFGGVQIILVGDFSQLPPVVTPSQEKQYADLMEPYCFQSVMWNYGRFSSINLTTNYRQSDQVFLQMLDEIRFGKVTDNTNKIMLSRVDKKFNIDIKPIKLFPYKVDVSTENKTCLGAIKEPKYLSKAEYTGKPFDTDILKKDTPAEDKLYFCKGAQVMMLTNDPTDRWVNGSMGIIIDVDPILIKLANGSVVGPEMQKWERLVHKLIAGKWKQDVVATMTQYPFKLAYATTIHKSQGLTLEYVELDISTCFVPGQAYVALSRVKSLEGLSLKSWNEKAIMADDRILKFYNQTRSSSDTS